MGEVSKVVSVDKISIVIMFVLAVVFLHEAFTLKSIVGITIITIGMMMVRKNKQAV